MTLNLKPFRQREKKDKDQKARELSGQFRTPAMFLQNVLTVHPQEVWAAPRRLCLQKAELASPGWGHRGGRERLGLGYAGWPLLRATGAGWLTPPGCNCLLTPASAQAAGESNNYSSSVWGSASRRHWKVVAWLGRKLRLLNLPQASFSQVLFQQLHKDCYLAIFRNLFSKSIFSSMHLQGISRNL